MSGSCMSMVNRILSSTTAWSVVSLAEASPGSAREYYCQGCTWESTKVENSIVPVWRTSKGTVALAYKVLGMDIISIFNYPYRNSVPR